MSLEMFTKIFNKLPRVLTQIAFGIGDIDSNPDMWKIFQYTRDHAVVPNVTINGRGITKKHALNLKKYCGAVAVSRYDKDNCYDTVKILTDVGLKQTNIHMLLSEETYDTCFEVLDDRENDKRLKDLNAIVFLTLKPKGRGKNMKPLKSVEKYKKLIEYALNRNIPIGFDSCSVPLFLKSVEDSKQYALYNQIAEPCESTLFSVYINVDGEMFPCSFLEDATFEGIDVLNTENFLKDIWFHPRTKSWRKQLLETGKKKDCMVKECRQCPVFDIY